MNKLKINTGLAAVVMLGCLISGWSTLLIVVVLMLIFCDINDAVKQLMVRVVTFYLGITLFSTAWGLIVDGVDLVISSFDKFIDIINSYLTDPIDVYKLELYLLSPISKVVSLVDEVVSYLLVFVKFSFIIAVLGNNNLKDNFIVQKLNIFVNKVISYVNSFDLMQNNSQPQSFDASKNVMEQENSGNQMFPM